MAYFDNLIQLQQQAQQQIRNNQKQYPKLKKPRPVNPDALTGARLSAAILRVC